MGIHNDRIFYYEGWFLAMPSQPMSAIRQLKRIDQKLNSFAFGASTGRLHIHHGVKLVQSYWVPMYSEAKLAFFIYLWYPKTKGTTYVYDSFFRPYVAKHEPEIDRSLSELRTRAGDIAVLYWQKAASYGQTRVFDILQYVAAQSTTSTRPTQQPSTARVRQPPSSNSQPAASTEPRAEDPSSASYTSSQLQKEVTEEPQVPKAPSSTVAAGLKSQKSNSMPENTNQSVPAEEESMAPSSSSANEDENPPLEDTIMEESIRVTRARLRKNRSAGIR
ncbi:HVA22-like protein i isoform X3 [Vigna unguiculata]|uniref:HVA22-like protein i isoform X3 n=1 Tax=Vigna unguiculata TaxID=3917 RepID=UPI0010164598|nr:HVA22-like protein i isoform X3 [Vigna unguiculata]